MDVPGGPHFQQVAGGRERHAGCWVPSTDLLACLVLELEVFEAGGLHPQPSAGGQARQAACRLAVPAQPGLPAPALTLSLALTSAPAGGHSVGSEVGGVPQEGYTFYLRPDDGSPMSVNSLDVSADGAALSGGFEWLWKQIKFATVLRTTAGG